MVHIPVRPNTAPVNAVTITNRVKLKKCFKKITAVNLQEWVEGVLKVSSACPKTPVNP
jgi:hypothetical protein